ncbi:helix-turn-helix domain-containing protein [Spiroplasma alleghenense]|uniref:Insertion element IS150 protein InsJ-like helix-turn-helix domain-containing protein n=1 Tax=Spiroplasma alleghenense TaxID=216931 RepID=A0A345Z577_9MOLU|nr:helix-turn-helix domain-containing protein [Spiroplasma alleghenense]AXK51756.1 hypothetical protein SALLE_v1c10860 [Spiroplasma alleghenense]
MANLKGNKSNILTIEQKINMVNEHFEKGASFKVLSEKYNVSYSMVRKTCLKFNEFGREGLIRDYTIRADSKTGKVPRINSLNPDKVENAKLNKKLKEAEAEIFILKKLHELMKNQKK